MSYALGAVLLHAIRKVMQVGRIETCASAPGKLGRSMIKNLVILVIDATA